MRGKTTKHHPKTFLTIFKLKELSTGSEDSDSHFNRKRSVAKLEGHIGTDMREKEKVELLPSSIRKKTLLNLETPVKTQ